MHQDFSSDLAKTLHSNFTSTNMIWFLVKVVTNSANWKIWFKQVFSHLNESFFCIQSFHSEILETNVFDTVWPFLSPTVEVSQLGLFPRTALSCGDPCIVVEFDIAFLSLLSIFCGFERQYIIVEYLFFVIFIKLAWYWSRNFKVQDLLGKDIVKLTISFPYEEK